MKRSVSRYFAELKTDPVARELLRSAAEEFSGTSADRAMIRRVKREAQRLAEDYVDLLLSGNLTAADAEAIREQLTGVEVDRRVPGIERDLGEIYKTLGIIREYTLNTVWLSCPQAAVDPMFLRAYDAQTMQSAAGMLNVNMEPLIRELERAHEALGLDQDVQGLIDAHAEWSEPLLLAKQPMSSMKVYFTGPIFYSGAKTGWTLTFSTSSGLPDPLEWHGSDWFAARYGVPAAELEGKGLKNPFRAINFAAGISNRRWKAKRIYVWQHSGTSQRVRAAYQLAANRGRGREYLADALNQLTTVFRTPGLKIIELQDFPGQLRTWTRVSQRNIMISHREGTPEHRIGYGVWLTRGWRLSDRAWKAIHTLVAGSLGVSLAKLGGGGLDSYLAALAAGCVMFLSEGRRESEPRKQSASVGKVVSVVGRAAESLWSHRGLPGTIKEREAYGSDRAIVAAATTLGSLLGVDRNSILEESGISLRARV